MLATRASASPIDVSPVPCRARSLAPRRRFLVLANGNFDAETSKPEDVHNWKTTVYTQSIRDNDPKVNLMHIHDGQAVVQVNRRGDTVEVSDFVLVSASGRGLMAFTNYMYKHSIVRALVTLPDDDGGARTPLVCCRARTRAVLIPAPVALCRRHLRILPVHRQGHDVGRGRLLLRCVAHPRDDQHLDGGRVRR